MRPRSLRGGPNAGASVRRLCGPRLSFDVELGDAPAGALREVGGAALLEDRERLDALVARPGHIAVRREQARRGRADLRASDWQSETEGMFETLGAPRVGDRKVAARTRDLDESRGDPGPAAAAFVLYGGRVRRGSVLPRVLERALIEREPRYLGGDARREVGSRRRSLRDRARLGKRGGRCGEVTALDRERAEYEQRGRGIGRLLALRE